MSSQQHVARRGAGLPRAHIGAGARHGIAVVGTPSQELHLPLDADKLELFGGSVSADGGGGGGDVRAVESVR